MDTVRICKKCGQPLPENAPEGLCPECLARVAFGTEPATKPDTTLSISPEAVARVRYFGDYELLEEIARGGMGIVWKARQTSLNRTVAVKMILTGELASEAEVQRFRREAEAAANLQHPNIVAIHEVGEHDGQHFYSMDYVEGRDLGTLVRESGPMAPAQAAECLKTIAEAVHFAHQRGTLHRDLKPQNVLIDSAGVPHVTDFGLAKLLQRNDNLTESGAAMGSPSYMPPEQAAGNLERIGPQSDVYALGAILYESLTGQPPFRAETPIATMQQVLESDPVSPRKVNPELPPDLETICLKCLEKNPERRYHSARALAEELTRFLNHEPIQALPISAFRKAESWLRRNPWTLMAAVSLVAMALMGLLYWQYERVKFLENPPLPTGRLLSIPALRLIHLAAWNSFAGLTNICVVFAFLVFRDPKRLNADLRNLFRQPPDYEASGPVSQSMRLACGLIAVAGLAFTAVYLGKLIRFSVWEGPPKILDWFRVYGDFYFSLMLLLIVVRDYQKSVHGLPSRNLSTEQYELFRSLIANGDSIGAIKMVRHAFPDSSLGEARALVVKFARDIANEKQLYAIKVYQQSFPETSREEARKGCEKLAADYMADLKAKNPQLFPSPRAWDLNWGLMGKTLVIDAALIAIFCWLVPLDSLFVRLCVFIAWFLAGAIMMLLVRHKNSWKRFLGIISCVFLASMLISGFILGCVSLAGYLLGTLLMVSGFTPKRRKSVPSKAPLDIGPLR